MSHELLRFIVEPVIVLLLAGLIAFLGRGVLNRWRIAERQRMAVAIGTAVGAASTDLKTLLDEHTKELGEVKDRLIRIETDQFGSNHGGLREQVDNIRRDLGACSQEVSEVNGRLDGILTALRPPSQT